jgi:hypothetical protein
MENGIKLDMVTTHSNIFFQGPGQLGQTLDTTGLNQNSSSKLKGAEMVLKDNWVFLTVQGRQYAIPASNIASARLAK